MARNKRNKKVVGVIAVGDVLVSADLRDEMFACDLARCKGACCVEGDLGAPLDKEELPVLKEIYPKIKPFLRPEGIRAIEEQGTHVRDFTGGYSTPLVQGKECAYVTFTPQGIALCGIEQAQQQGVVEFRKPISCHLYPIRIKKYKDFDALNYDEWDICSPACSKGSRDGTPVYVFLKEALIRKYGEEFYYKLDQIAQEMKSAEQQEES
ncbi:MAG: DUF3109 family protein [Bacteroidetes bacterium]|nr:MAG: DUF3109 family protein [Bacteroidota bacterium]